MISGSCTEVGCFGCLEVSLYGIRELVSATPRSIIRIWDLECSTLPLSAVKCLDVDPWREMFKTPVHMIHHVQPARYGLLPHHSISVQEQCISEHEGGYVV